MRVFYYIAICAQLFFSLVYLLRRDYSAARETMILAFLFLVIMNQAKEAE